MDTKLLQRLVRIMEKAELTELEIDDQTAGLRVHLRRGGEREAAATPVFQVAPGAPVVPAAVPAAPATAAAAPASPADDSTPFLSPMVGTFYRAVSPDAEPFVAEGARVGPDSVLCIIEAMKVMNEIKAETSGVIARVLVENGEPVEFGQPLFLLRPS